MCKALSRVRVSNSVTPWTIQSRKFSRPEYWRGQLFPPPGRPLNTSEYFLLLIWNINNEIQLISTSLLDEDRPTLLPPGPLDSTTQLIITRLTFLMYSFGTDTLLFRNLQQLLPLTKKSPNYLFYNVRLSQICSLSTTFQKYFF